jgi:hypothetical protein
MPPTCTIKTKSFSNLTPTSCARKFSITSTHAIFLFLRCIIYSMIRHAKGEATEIWLFYNFRLPVFIFPRCFFPMYTISADEEKKRRWVEILFEFLLRFFSLFSRNFFFTLTILSLWCVSLGFHLYP